MDYAIIDYVYKHAADWGVDPVATGRQLKKLRRQHNFTQKDLSELLDYCYDSTATREYICEVENGRAIFSIHLLLFLSELYGCPLDELVVSYRRSRETEDRDQPVPLKISYFIYLDECMLFAYVRLFCFVNSRITKISFQKSILES